MSVYIHNMYYMWVGLLDVLSGMAGLFRGTVGIILCVWAMAVLPLMNGFYGLYIFLLLALIDHVLVGLVCGGILVLAGGVFFAGNDSIGKVLHFVYLFLRIVTLGLTIAGLFVFSVIGASECSSAAVAFNQGIINYAAWLAALFMGISLVYSTWVILAHFILQPSECRLAPERGYSRLLDQEPSSSGMYAGTSRYLCSVTKKQTTQHDGNHFTFSGERPAISEQKRGNNREFYLCIRQRGHASAMHSFSPREHVEDEYVIGRSPECDLVVDDSRISRRHCVLYRGIKGGIYVRDLGSGNGTVVHRANGTLVDGKQAVQLMHGDCIMPGKSGPSHKEIGIYFYELG